MALSDRRRGGRQWRLTELNRLMEFFYAYFFPIDKFQVKVLEFSHIVDTVFCYFTIFWMYIF